ncbi:Uncharacterised protein [Bordetella pertussis]|nr:Uncharacterised protein [Bordetella pertussis]CFO37480.1 Uncharacterised protein [Bordetella pertussis]CFP56011.1 Uncharacterised protein [Bordetella pertussis]CPK94435.1 Uncharacterised protein [Bordetella pertussis]CPM29605.1 Uncharacterised protein [Bordetella pertussis]
MPNVRASSATMGTMRGPSCGSFSKAVSMRTMAMVEDISLPAACSANRAQSATGGGARRGASVRRRGR